MQLEAVKLQEPTEERVDRESYAPQNERNEAHLLLFRKIGEIFCQGFAIKGS